MDHAMNFVWLAGAFVVTAGVVWLLGRMIFPPRISAERIAGSRPAEDEALWAPRVAALVGPAARLSAPKAEQMRSRVRVRMMHAGWRGENAPVIFYGMKTLLVVVAPVALFLIALLNGTGANWLTLLLAAMAGFLLPDVFLILKVRRRQREIFNAFPEALDLMVVCVEAGLALDAAISKVADEMGRSSPELGEELHLTTLELRAGVSRESALRNLAHRTGVEDIDGLVAMLIQSDRFGTSVADSMRVHADGMRTKRMLRAEEAAQKLPVKLVFPVVMLIFPALFLVLLGPSIIIIMKVLVPMMK